MAGIGPATSPLPRECSTTEPHGQNLSPSRNNVERETGIEPASLAWKAKVLPLNYSRIEPDSRSSQLQVTKQHTVLAGGGGWIRTSVGVSQQIYSLPPLATRAPLRRTSKYSTIILQKHFKPPEITRPRRCEAPNGGGRGNSLAAGRGRWGWDRRAALVMKGGVRGGASGWGGRVRRARPGLVKSGRSR